jgi:hypothetical protein
MADYRVLRRVGEVSCVVCVALIAFAGAGLMLYSTAGPPVPLASTQAPPALDPLPPGSYPEGPLAVGTKAPGFVAGGWINGTPNAPGTPAARLVVVDLWALW